MNVGIVKLKKMSTEFDWYDALRESSNFVITDITKVKHGWQRSDLASCEFVIHVRSCFVGFRMSKHQYWCAAVPQILDRFCGSDFLDYERCDIFLADSFEELIGIMPQSYRFVFDSFDIRGDIWDVYFACVKNEFVIARHTRDEKRNEGMMKIPKCQLGEIMCGKPMVENVTMNNIADNTNPDFKKIPFEVVVNDIFPFLTVFDHMRLRFVNKESYAMTSMLIRNFIGKNRIHCITRDHMGNLACYYNSPIGRYVRIDDGVVVQKFASIGSYVGYKNGFIVLFVGHGHHRDISEKNIVDFKNVDKCLFSFHMTAKYEDKLYYKLDSSYAYICDDK